MLLVVVREDDDDFLVPFNAADRLRAGDGVLPPRGKEGRFRRLPLGFKRLERWRVGDRPAAVAGADEGVVLDDLLIYVVSSRGVRVSRRRLVEVEVTVGVTVNEYRLALDADTSSSKADRLRLFNESRILGSMFSLSDPISGDAARRLRDGAELGVIATDGMCEHGDARHGQAKLTILSVLEIL